MTHWPPKGVLAVAASIALIATLPAGAEEHFRILGAKEIRAKVVGRAITDGVHWSWYFRPDGALISVEMSKRRVGSWRIQENKLCWEIEKGKQLECSQVWMSGENISLRFEQGIPELEATVESHRGP